MLDNNTRIHRCNEDGLPQLSCVPSFRSSCCLASNTSSSLQECSLAVQKRIRCQYINIYQVHSQIHEQAQFKAHVSEAYPTPKQQVVYGPLFRRLPLAHNSFNMIHDAHVFITSIAKIHVQYTVHACGEQFTTLIRLKHTRKCDIPGFP